MTVLTSLLFRDSCVDTRLAWRVDHTKRQNAILRLALILFMVLL